ncbi:ATP-dependent helicase [Salimicrobium halophilum]|uniref:DNA 3'-5' helicase n=1 Tax=Salimicrobium halophilum TaxID=86666 RepID=A0A1G8UCV7_9BACI|nr:ATP-dependent helicase [Salimicrobium halophilum]SDJ51562.1 DNA helicase-2 / ATP-dependent DNA helicase PcrA [Salimicrobium halophilum]
MSEQFFQAMKEQTGVELNEEQKQAVLHTSGPLLLLASPGAGKTTTLTMKIAYLMFEKQISPDEIMAVTFSKASAQDMSKRFAEFFSGWGDENIHFSTIHSFAFKVVREFMGRESLPYQLIEGGGHKQDPQTGMPLHKTFILKKVFEDINKAQPTEEEMDELTTFISFAKNRLLEGNELTKQNCQVPNAPEVYRAYESFKQTYVEALLLDFDDMLTFAHEILRENEDILNKYQQQYKYILTDESQDNSIVQHEIMEMLSAPDHNLCLVADDDQSIFRWRGSDVEKLLEFEQTYANATVLTMTENYRSSKEIVEAANRFIKRNNDRYEKEMTTGNDAHAPVEIHTFSNDEKQLDYVVDQIKKKAPGEEVAVLYRNNSSVIPLVDQLDRGGVDFYMKDMEAKFFRHWIVEDMLNFLRFSYKDSRIDILEKIHMKFNAYISKKQMTMLKARHTGESLFDQLLELDIKDYQKKTIPKAKKTFQEINQMPPAQAIRTIRDTLGYDRVLRKMVDNFGFRSDQLFGTLDVLERIAEGCDSLRGFAGRLKELEELVKSSRSNESTLTLTTFHSAKGLEFDSVYMIDLINGVVPSREDIEDYQNGKGETMEEAVRLFYVGMTRARSRLELLTYHYLGNERVTESMFVTNVRNITGAVKKVKHRKGKTYSPTPEIKDMEPGTRVVHDTFGRGVIKEYGGDLIHIRFEKAGEKQLLLDTCIENGLLQKEDGA